MDDRTRTLRGHAAAEPAPALAEWGPFRLLSKVGQGSFGEVYRAFDPALQREVALKLLRPTGSSNEAEYQAVVREARLLAKVRHPNVLPVHGVDEHQGRVGFWSDFVEGKTLSELVAEQGPFGPREAVGIAIELGQAVSAVHSAGLLHRDIKTGNVMREVGGRIVLMDFGLTQDRAEPAHFGGTPAYMAPELRRGQPATVATDLFALGVLIFHLLTGQYPVSEDGARRRLLDLRPDLPEPLARTVEKALASEPTGRFASAGEMIAGLSAAMGGDVQVAPAAAAKPRNWWWALVPVAAAVALAVAYLNRTGVAGNTAITDVTAGGAHALYAKAQDQLDRYYQPQGIAKARGLFEETIQADPQFALAYTGLARANLLSFTNLGDSKYVEPAIAAATKALALDPSLASAHVTLGRVYTETAKNDLAAQELNQALRLDARNAEAYQALAELYLRQGRVKEVEPTLQKAIDLAPRDWRFADRMAQVHTASGNYPRALEWAEKAVALTPENARALNNLSTALAGLHRLEEAQRAVERAIALEPGFNRYINLGNILQYRREYAPAVDAYRKAIELNEKSYLAWGNLALAYARMPAQEAASRAAYQKAVALAEELREKRPNDATLLSLLGVYGAALGDAAGSEERMRQALALAPEDPLVLLRAAQRCERLRDRAGALRWAAAALERGLDEALIERLPELDNLRRDPQFLSLARKSAKTLSPKETP